MMRHEFSRTYSRPRGFCLRADAVFLGVCASVAPRIGISPWWGRALALFGLFSAPVAAIAIYLLAAVLIARHPVWR